MIENLILLLSVCIIVLYIIHFHYIVCIIVSLHLINDYNSIIVMIEVAKCDVVL